VRQFLQSHYLATSRESRRCLQPICGCRHSATLRESKAHFGLPGYASGTIAVNAIWIEREFNACQTPRSINLQPVSLKIRHFSTFFAHFGLPWVRPWDNRGKYYMERGFNAGQTHRSMYPSIFNSLRAIARYWSEFATFSYLPCI